jgi:hypothetical protein
MGRKWAAAAKGADLDRNLAEELGVEPGAIGKRSRRERVHVGASVPILSVSVSECLVGE